MSWRISGLQISGAFGLATSEEMLGGQLLAVAQLL